MQRWRNLLLAALALLVLALIMAYFTGAFHTKVQPASERGLDVLGETLIVDLTSVAETAPVPGTVRATDETVIGSRILATVTRMRANAGDPVQEGDLLVELDSSGPSSVLEQREQAATSARAALEEAENNRARAERLFQSGNLSRADYDRALTNHRVAQAEAERAVHAAVEARTHLGYTRITAPMSGTVVEHYLEAGDTATPGQPLLKLFNPGRLRVEAILRESLIRFVVPGSALDAHIDALRITVPSTVEEIVPSADPGSRTFTIKALLPPLADLYPGMFARLEIPTGTAEKLLVPAAAVHEAGQLRFVYVRGADRTHRRFVRLGKAQDTRLEIVSGLTPGETIIVPDLAADAPVSD